MRHRLSRDIVLALIAKLVALTAIYLMFFDKAPQQPLDPAMVSARVLGVDEPLNQR